MNDEVAKAFKIALEAVAGSFDAPMKLAADADDQKIRRMIGALASEVASKIDYEILPYLYSRHPELKTDD